MNLSCSFSLNEEEIFVPYCGKSQKSLADTIKKNGDVLVSLFLFWLGGRREANSSCKEFIKPAKRLVEMSVRYLLVFLRGQEFV